MQVRRRVPVEPCVAVGPLGSVCSTACAAAGPCPDGFFCTAANGGLCFADERCEPLDCTAENTFGMCHGQSACTPTGPVACLAPTPAPETCNGVDDDCDGATDEATEGAPCTVDNAFGSCPGVPGAQCSTMYAIWAYGGGSCSCWSGIATESWPGWYDMCTSTCLCGDGLHDGGDGACVPEDMCSAGYHDGGDGDCEPLGQCRPGYHDGGAGACVAGGTCSPGYHDGGTGGCVALGACVGGYHDGGDGSCVPDGQCAVGHHDGGGGACVASGACSSGYHQGGYDYCLAPGQCSPGHDLVVGGPDDGTCLIDPTDVCDGFGSFACEATCGGIHLGETVFALGSNEACAAHCATLPGVRCAQMYAIWAYGGGACSCWSGTTTDYRPGWGDLCSATCD